jgi:WhiB family redox-sensing transcriptional regulator
MFELADDWQRLAACKGPYAEFFFPPNAPERKDDKIERESAAKAICSDCRVCDDCLDYAMGIQEPHGIWGGLNEVERRSLVELRSSR